MVKKIIIVVLITSLCIWMYIVWFQSWKNRHDADIISSTIKKVHMYDIYNMEVLNYYDTPWGINRFEFEALSSSKIPDFSNIPKHKIFNSSFIKTQDINNNFKIKYYFNKEGLLYCIHEWLKSDDIDDIQMLESSVENNFTYYDLKFDENQKNLNLANRVAEITWTDQYGKIEKKVFDGDSFIDFYDYIICINFGERVFNNAMILKLTSRYNSTTIEHILKKYDQTSYVQEFIYTNEILLH